MDSYNLKISKNELTIKVKKCENLASQIQGLMFRKHSPSLLFIFKKPKKIAIHSYFCKPFIGIWLLDDKIIDKKLVEPNAFSVKPKGKFNKLLEIPSNTKEFDKILQILDDN